MENCQETKNQSTHKIIIISCVENVRHTQTENCVNQKRWIKRRVFEKYVYVCMYIGFIH